MLGEAPVLSSEIVEQVSHGNRLLVVDDEAISLAFLKQHLVELGYDVITADSGRQALQVLEQSGDTIDVVILDRIMPGIDGIATAEEMRRDPSLRHIPIVMQTGADSSKDVQEGIDAGVFYYLTKPIDGSLLRSVVNAAIKESGRRRSLRTEIATQSSGMQLMQSCRFNVRTPQEAEGIACFVANCFADPERAMMGLIELTVNAVEHGNLEIGYEAKTKLLKNGELTQEIERRLADKKYAGRMVELVVVRKNGGVYARITDQGTGFDWRSYVSIDPARASDSHGRGIAQANAVAFDKVSYNESGNQVLAFMSDTPKLDW